MRKGWRWLALLLAVMISAAAVPGIWAADNNGVITPALWSDAGHLEWYSVYKTDSGRQTGQPQTMEASFTVRAGLARLTVVNQGIRELDVALNGQRLNLNSFFDEGAGQAVLDISRFVHYGPNSMTVVCKGKPGTTAILSVECPVFPVRILHINDIHGKIDPLPKAAAYVKSAKAAGGDVFFVDAGDDFSGNPVCDLNKGVPVIQILNAMKTDVLAAGNHNFDYGPGATQARRMESGFPWLAANISVVDQGLTAIQPFVPYKVFQNRLGQRIAFVAVTETPPSTGAKNVIGLHFSDPLAAAERMVNELRDQVNLLVIISHCGLDFDERLAAEVQGIDLILGGHSHTYLQEPAVVNGVPIIQAGSGGTYLTDLHLVQGETVTARGGASGGAYTVPTGSLTAADPEVKTIVDGWNAQMAAVLDAKIGYTPIELDRDSRYSKDVSIGNLITDAMRDYMGTQIGLTNNGGIRASIPAGDISMRSVYEVLPFGNFVMKFSLTGAQVREIIEYSWNRDNRRQVDLQTSGLSYSILTNPDGTIHSLDLKVNGQPISPTALYSVAVADYLGTGGGGYPLPGMAAPQDISSDVDAIVVGEYIRKVGTLNYAPTENRIMVKAAPVPTAVAKLNFYNSSSLLAAGEGGTLVPLTNQATVLVTGESTLYQYERSATAPKNFPKIDAGSPIPLAALQQVGGGQVVGLGAIIVANGYRTAYQNPQWFTNLMDRLTGTRSGSILFDCGHGQYYNASRMSTIAGFLSDRGYTPVFTAANTRLTAELLTGIRVLVITTPGNVGVYSADELSVLRAFVNGGGSVILMSQTDYNNNSNPAEFNAIAAAIGTVIRFNSDEVRDNSSNDGTNYSPVTNEFNPAYPDLLKPR